jgi:hypothetical protein
MSVIKQIVGARTALTVAGFSTLASATYVASNAYVCNTNQPTDVIVEVDCATSNTPVGNRQVAVFILDSLDGVNFRSGVTSGTVTTDEFNMKYLGNVPVGAPTSNPIGMFSIFAVLGYVPFAFKVVLKNDLGVALTSGAVFTSEISNTIS